MSQLPLTHTARVEIQAALRWEIHDDNLSERLYDYAADSAPGHIIGTAYTGEVAVDADDFVVTLTQGEPYA